jgi:hypothetical protein
VMVAAVEPDHRRDGAPLPLESRSAEPHSVPCRSFAKVHN